MEFYDLIYFFGRQGKNPTLCVLSLNIVPTNLNLHTKLTAITAIYVWLNVTGMILLVIHIIRYLLFYENCTFTFSTRRLFELQVAIIFSIIQSSI